MNIKTYLSSINNIFILVSLLLLFIVILPMYTDNGIMILFCQFILIIFIYLKLFKSSKWSLLLIVYPLFKFLYYESFSAEWFLAGDFEGYISLLESGFQNRAINLENILIVNEIYGKFFFLTIINIFIPMELYDINLATGESYIYLYFNDLVYLFMISIIVLAYKNMIKDKYILFIVLFLLYSPSYLMQTVYPDRHIFSLFALLLFVKGFIVFKKGNKFNLYILFSFLIILVNKPQLLIAMVLYMVIHQYRNSKNRNKAIKLILMGFFMGVVFFLAKDTIINYFFGFGIKVGGVSMTLKSILGPFYLIIMAPVKYIYAILSPFPWYKYDVFIANLGGSYLGVLSAYLNSVFGLSFFIALIKYFNIIKQQVFFYNYFILFGIIMSSTIVLSEIGHAAYLSLYYIFFLPIFFIIGFKETITVLSWSFVSLTILNLLLFSVGL